MKKTKIVVLVFALLLGMLVVVGIRKQRENVFETDENINISETTGSCFGYSDTADGVRVIKRNFHIDAPFVDSCKKIINTSEEFSYFKNLYISNDNYHNFCSNKSSLTIDDENYMRKITLENVLNGLMSNGLEITVESETYDYYIVKDVNKCVTFLENEGYEKEELFDYCSGKNTSLGNLYEDNREYVPFYNKDIVYKMIESKILTPNDVKMTYINSYDSECGNKIIIPKKIDGKEIYGINLVLENAEVLLLPSSLKRIDYISGLNVKNLVIPKNVTYIYDSSFENNDIENLIFNGNTIILNNAFNDKVKTVKYGGTCEELNRYKDGFNNYNNIEFKDKKGSCSINEE